MFLKIEKKGGGLPLLAAPAYVIASVAIRYLAIYCLSRVILFGEKQSIAGSSSTPSNGRSGAAPVTPWLRAF